MIEPLTTRELLQEFRTDVYVLPERLKPHQDSLSLEALLHAYAHIPFYHRFGVQ